MHHRTSRNNPPPELRAKQSPPSFRRLIAFLLALSATLAAMGQTNKPPKAATASSAPGKGAMTNSPWGKIVMVGASVSAGFIASEPLGGSNTPQYRLSRYLDAALLVPHPPVQNLANTFFFVQPEAAGRQQIEEALKATPTLVVGIDFLFWFCYGEGNTDEERLQRFETGLKILEAVKCPLVLGDIPDASAAVNGMLRPDQIPSAKAMAAANQRSKEWAATRPQVAILQLSGIMRTVLANQPLTVHGYALPEGKTRILLQDDQLHPSPPGCAVIALAALDALHLKQPFPAGQVRWDPKEVFRSALKTAASIQSKPAESQKPGPK